MKQKYCCQCKREKPISAFGKNKRKKDGLAVWCKECRNGYTRHWYSEGIHAVEHKQRVQKNKEEYRQWFQQLKAGKQCCRCPESNPACLDFHHTGKKDFSVSQWQRLGTSKKRLLAEVEKCIILCSNCHRKLHHNVT